MIRPSICHYLKQGCIGGILYLKPDGIIESGGGWENLEVVECSQGSGHDLDVHSTWVMWRSPEHSHPLGITEGVCRTCERTLYNIKDVSTEDDDDDD